MNKGVKPIIRILTIFFEIRNPHIFPGSCSHKLRFSLLWSVGLKQQQKQHQKEGHGGKESAVEDLLRCLSSDKVGIDKRCKQLCDRLHGPIRRDDGNAV